MLSLSVGPEPRTAGAFFREAHSPPVVAARWQAGLEYLLR
jgi:hypothetical protein